MIQLIKNTANSLLHELQVTATRKVRKGELKFSEESSKTERGIQTNKQNKVLMEVSRASPAFETPISIRAIISVRAIGGARGKITDSTFSKLNRGLCRRIKVLKAHLR